MKKVYGYIRVSTVKQGEGVSLEVQKEAITRYATQHSLTIQKWFEEKETAAKQGRPLFTQMMNLLKAHAVSGVIMHKIDRSARNLKDWADLGALIDQGVEVHFAHESLDLKARGGRLSADIQAVIAADYIRNLRQEAIKGLYGRINQGIYPFQAPIGYLDEGGGKVKSIDPKTAPFVQMLFNVYATNSLSLTALSKHMFAHGFTNKGGAPWEKNRLSKILNNPFYIGLMKVRKSLYEGKHQPLIEPEVFAKVQEILNGKSKKAVFKHDFTFRKLLKCKGCNYYLTGEIQKGYVYYRCHTKSCITKGIRSSTIECMVSNLLRAINFTPEEEVYWEQEDQLTIKQNAQELSQQSSNLEFRINQLRTKLDRLTDCLIDGDIDKLTHDHKKESLLVELKEKEAQLKKVMGGNNLKTVATKEFFELVKSIDKSYQNGNPQEKRELLKIVTSNFLVEGKNVEIIMDDPYKMLLELRGVSNGGDSRIRLKKMQGCFSYRDISAKKPLKKKQVISYYRKFVRYIEKKQKLQELENAQGSVRVPGYE